MLVRLMFLTVLIAMPACGDTSKLADSIDKASEAAKDEEKPEIEVSEDDGSVSVTTTVTVTTTVDVDGESSSEDQNVNPLFGTWVSQCDDGVIISLSFGEKVVTKITSVYDDVTECSGMPQSVTQRIGYEVVGDNAVSFGKSSAEEFSIDGDYLILSADPSYEYRRK